MTRVAFSFRRTGLIAGVTLREAVRQKLFTLLVVLALGLVMSVGFLRDFNFGSPELKFIADFGDGAIAFFGAALTITATAQLFFSEIENRTALTLLAKAVWRTEFVVGKFLGVAAVAAGFCLLLSAALAAVLWSRETALMHEFPETFAAGRVVHYGNLAAAAWLQWLKLTLLASGTLLVSCFAQTQLFAVMMGFGIFVICHLQNLAQGTSFWLRIMGRITGWIFPDFQLFAAGIDLEFSGPALVRLSVYALGHVAVAGALATYAFRQREI